MDSRLRSKGFPPQGVTNPGSEGYINTSTLTNSIKPILLVLYQLLNWLGSEQKCQELIQVYGYMYPTKFFAIAFLTADHFQEGGKMRLQEFLFLNLYPPHVPKPSVLFNCKS